MNLSHHQQIFTQNVALLIIKANSLAVDFNFFVAGVHTFTDPLVEKLGKYWESLDPLNRWGGHFNNFYDASHFERRIR